VLFQFPNITFIFKFLSQEFVCWGLNFVLSNGQNIFDDPQQNDKPRRAGAARALCRCSGSVSAVRFSSEV
jgi:hypothetical protein